MERACPSNVRAWSGFARLREKARARTGKVFPFVVIQEAGLDGFWIDRALQNEGIESHVVDPASITRGSPRLYGLAKASASAVNASLSELGTGQRSTLR